MNLTTNCWRFDFGWRSASALRYPIVVECGFSR
jgi:hypothetical protein